MTPDAWLFRLDLPADQLDALATLLAPDERDRADRFRFAADRRRFVARRGQLRLLLATYSGERAERIAFAANAYGKPVLRYDEAWHFNASHAGELGLCVVGRDPVGCDIERHDPALADRATAVRFFAAAELAALDALPAEAWSEGFFNCWTRKEAYVKALGLGLSCPLDSFAVSVASDLPATLEGAAPGWSIHGFAPAPGYHAAIVARGDAAAPIRWFRPSEGGALGLDEGVAAGRQAAAQRP